VRSLRRSGPRPVDLPFAPDADARRVGPAADANRRMLSTNARPHYVARRAQKWAMRREALLTLRIPRKNQPMMTIWGKYPPCRTGTVAPLYPHRAEGPGHSLCPTREAGTILAKRERSLRGRQHMAGLPRQLRVASPSPRKRRKALFGELHEDRLFRVIRARAGHRRHGDDCWSDASQPGGARACPDAFDAGAEKDKTFLFRSPAQIAPRDS
jgi:hypothetical protein